MGLLEGRVAIITGGTRGIGRAISTTFAADGARVAVVARTESEVLDTASVLQESGSEAIGLTADITDFGDVARLIERVEADLGAVDVLVNNAGGPISIGPIAEADPDAWRADVALNLLGPFHVCRCVLPRMIERSAGRIINMCGAGTREPFANLSAYGSAKAAVMRFTETLDQEVAGTGIRVFAMDPGLVDTPAHAPHMASGLYERLFPEVHDLFTKGLVLPPSVPAKLALQIAAGTLDELHGRLLDPRDDLDPTLEATHRIVRENVRILRVT
jgi:NAD(P)-dependent dehydrogenase (short-subunit alcohol dehydrogenase family)